MEAKIVNLQDLFQEQISSIPETLRMGRICPMATSLGGCA